jgi:hypothetical protein
MILWDAYCPMHNGPLVSVEEKPEYFAKCCWKKCGYGILANDPTMTIQDVHREN